MKEIEIINDILDNEISNLKKLQENFKQKHFYQNFISALKMIKKCKGKVLVSGVGKSGLIGKKVSSIFSSIGVSSFFVHPVEAIHGDLGCIQKKDILIALSCSGNTKEMFEIIDYCKRNKIQTIAITAGEKSFLSENCDVSIVFNINREAIDNFPIPTTSSILTLSICDALTACLVHNKHLTHKQYGEYHCGGKIGEQMKKLNKTK